MVGKHSLQVTVLLGVAMLAAVMIVGCGPADDNTALQTPGVGGVPTGLPDTGSELTGTLPGPSEGFTVTQPAPGGDVTGTVPGAVVPPPGAITGTVNRVEVVLQDYTIEMPEELPAGPTFFRVTNSGMDQHSFYIETTGIEHTLARDLAPGQTDGLTMTLAPGLYQVYCPVPGHSEMGMSLTLTVVEDQ